MHINQSWPIRNRIGHDYRNTFLRTPLSSSPTGAPGEPFRRTGPAPSGRAAPKFVLRKAVTPASSGLAPAAIRQVRALPKLNAAQTVADTAFSELAAAKPTTRLRAAFRDGTAAVPAPLRSGAARVAVARDTVKAELGVAAKAQALPQIGPTARPRPDTRGRPPHETARPVAGLAALTTRPAPVSGVASGGAPRPSVLSKRISVQTAEAALLAAASGLLATTKPTHTKAPTGPESRKAARLAVVETAVPILRPVPRRAPVGLGRLRRRPT